MSNDIHGFNRQGTKRIIDAVRKSEDEPLRTEGQPVGGGSNFRDFWAKVISRQAENDYTVRRVIPSEDGLTFDDDTDDAGAFIEYTNVHEMNGRDILSPDDIVRLRPRQDVGNDVDDTTVLHFEAMAVGVIYGCKVFQNGGVAGDDATNCTFTYDMRLLDGVTVIATAQGVEYARYPLCTYTAADENTYGSFLYDGANIKLLDVVDEIAGDTKC